MMRLRLLPTLVLAGLLALTSGCTSASSSGTDTGTGTPTAAVRSETVSLQRDDIQLAGTLDVPENATGTRKVPLVLLLHGLGGSQDDPVIEASAQALNNDGIATLRIDFDGHGASGGEFREMTVPSEIEDARTAYEYAEGLSFVSTIGLAGHSQGGVVASMLAGQLGEKITATALLAPAATIPQMARSGNFLGTEFDPADPPATITVDGQQLGRNYILTAQKLPLNRVAARYTGPVTVIQGEDDDVIPVASSQKFVTVFSHGELHLLSGQGHDFSSDPSEPASLVAGFLSARLS
ncbi:alpha/beta fold hydrolase [Kineosporia sp. J2-2]|uniref:Alpha/beta fold hydrolase n=1 Tax=Kineosporia corallincola TaxID=2835133 RepID=A0ABS5TRS0_9ACTN|nr:alpha/beta fold hydrolase [Kineosporia corallincola]MBT0773501.1 alpha/beta fold hydrolase [Kineosporia corallincola]